MIRNVKKEDAGPICEIYNYYVENTVITFEEKTVSVPEMRNRIDEITDLFPWLICEEEGIVCGYAYASRWKSRSAYRYSVESTVYLSEVSVGQGIGTQIYEELINRLRSLSIHSLIGGIALPNPACVALHEKLGFEKVAHFKEVGCKMSRWIDVEYWELILNT